MAQQEFMNGQEAAAYLGISKARLYRLTRAGRIGQRIGGYWLYTKPELDAYKQERAQRPKGGRPKEYAGTLAAAVSPAVAV